MIFLYEKVTLSPVYVQFDHCEMIKVIASITYFYSQTKIIYPC